MIIDTKIKMLESLTADLTDKKVNNPYNLLIKLGRLLDGFPTEFGKANPDLVLMVINKVDELILFKRIEEFFTLFPPIKNYVGDGTWTYKNTLEHVAEQIFDREKFGESKFTLEYESTLKEIMNSTKLNVNELDDAINYYCALSS